MEEKKLLRGDEEDGSERNDAVNSEVGANQAQNGALHIGAPAQENESLMESKRGAEEKRAVHLENGQILNNTALHRVETAVIVLELLLGGTQTDVILI